MQTHDDFEYADYEEDDIELVQVLKKSREDFLAKQRQGSTASASLDQRQELEDDIARYTIEIEEYDETIRRATAARAAVQAQLEARKADLEAWRQRSRAGTSTSFRAGSEREDTKRIDYMKDTEWTVPMKANMKKYFGIKEFRLCQAGVCNANIDGRDIVCVMPTGGGKSLTYQLPAIMRNGCTVVVSPLISLMTDQIMHLRQFGINGIMMRGGMKPAEKEDVRRRLTRMASGEGEHADDIKLCYLTPEMMAKSKSMQSLLQKLADVGKLSRIVIDEAHCISQQGHDFRPDYVALSRCRTLWPHVPIMALSATCPPAVLKDILSVLKMGNVVNGQDAPRTKGTVYFSSPLYRKNLHYQVLPKASNADQVLRDITNYITDKHRNDSGIIYCFTKKDAVSVAQGVLKHSEGKITTGVFHSDISNEDRDKLHKAWRDGSVQVVCATIAFGLGIDKGDVRFVIHHSISKSLDGFYQESGRAGRDGKDADCVLYYRPQDWATVAAVTAGDSSSGPRLHEMLSFAQDMKRCRKTHFAEYFRTSSNLDTASWTTADEDAMTPCGHCDNCTREKDTFEKSNQTLHAWKILMIAEKVHRERGRVTLSQLADMARGVGKCEFGVASRKGKGRTRTEKLTTDTLIGETITTLSKDQVQTLCIQLLLDGYLHEEYSSTAYSYNVYLQPTDKSFRITRHSIEAFRPESIPKPWVECFFANKPRRSTGKKRAIATDNSDDERVPSSSTMRPARGKKRKSSPIVLDSDDAEELEPDEYESLGDDSSLEDDWHTNLRISHRKKAKTSPSAAKRTKTTRLLSPEVIEVSD